jgi:uncharacterized membrane protein YgdD (TMEM256/DUF423 family)
MSSANKKVLCIGASFALLAVLLGAFGAHALKSTLSPYQLGIYDTAVEYQMVHSLALLFSVILGEQVGRSGSPHRLKWAQFLFVLGIVVFSGSLYCLALTGLKWLGAITPVGGLAFILAWICMIWFAMGINSFSDANPDAQTKS